MNTSNKQNVQQIVFNRLSGIGFEDFMNLSKKCAAKPYLFLVINNTLKSDNPLRFKRNLSERMQEIVMNINDKIKDEELLYGFNREASKIYVLSSLKIDKYEYLTGEEILSNVQSQSMEQDKKALEKKAKTIKDKEEKKTIKNRLKKQMLDADQKLNCFPKIFFKN